LERRPQRETRADRLLAELDDAVLRPRRDGHRVAGAEPLLLAGDDQSERAVENLVPLLLARMQMVARREPARHELELVLQHLAAGLRAGAQKGQPLAGGGILEHVTSTRHERDVTPFRGGPPEFAARTAPRPMPSL